MLRKLFMMFVVVPLGIIFVVFAVANRHFVTVSLDPFGEAAPELSVTVPLFILIILLMVVGVLIGSLATWISQGRWRKAARQSESELRALRVERDALQPEVKRNEVPLLPPPVV
ncbi:hypothetical protein GJW-30_1_04277 [Variibacter gotjawalensis]|uniref:Lipopolysaccharide assembly protein A domain-containing protein n=1 Tax=Variibacter gotjawalensis TaxID=1333996 RepID=A0A0S3Q0L1_9BRAD|nr:LapA family protein [Variibacter gotjawalensis]NIK47556.1 putative integral membrane protein [Variibacter gotjawalensis]RZS49453.1 uncharacterized protein DUF1049 [Variibacter gotjawalensis]BAT61716.1 hypothetical protein GJW-30_1_04277 [Variibacter gotjawalensis]